MKKIAFCFMIYECIENEDAWRSFFEGVSPDKYTIYLHPKRPGSYTGLFAEHVIDENVKTDYGCWTLVQCSNALFRAAYHDVNNVKFILLSGHCIPVKSFDYIYNLLTADENAYIQLCPEVQKFPRNIPLLKHTTAQNIAKHSQWVILTRPDVQLFKDDPHLEWFHNVGTPDESYYMTLLRMYNKTSHVISGEHTIDRTTFTNWEGDNDYAFYEHHRGLKTYNDISKAEYTYLCDHIPFPLFARKFGKGALSSQYSK